MKVRYLVHRSGAKLIYPGLEEEVSKEKAERLIKGGIAEESKKKKRKEPEVVTTEVKKPKRRKKKK